MSKDRHGNDVVVGALVRVVRLAGKWLDELPEDERTAVLSMVGETFRVWEIDSHGHPCVMKEFPGETADSVTLHEVALDADEYELVASA